MELIWIRHFPTEGNLKRQYIGITDEPLARRRIPGDKGVYPQAEFVVVSPMKRCRETAELLYPGVPVWICEAFRECDFGRFEGKSYEELKEDPDYQKWLASGGTLPFPEGESHEAFVQRCIDGMECTMKELADRKIERAAIVVHGGTIMSVLSAFDRKGRNFYDFQAANGKGFRTVLDERKWENGEKYFMEIEAL